MHGYWQLTRNSKLPQFVRVTFCMLAIVLLLWQQPACMAQADSGFDSYPDLTNILDARLTNVGIATRGGNDIVDETVQNVPLSVPAQKFNPDRAFHVHVETNKAAVQQTEQLGTPLSLRGAFEQAMGNNLQIKIATAQAKQQTAAAATSLSRYLPDIAVTLENASQHKLGVTSPRVSGAVLFNFPLDTNLSVTSGSIAAIENARAAWYTRNAVINTIMLQVATAYSDMVAAQAIYLVHRRGYHLMHYWIGNCMRMKGLLGADQHLLDQAIESFNSKMQADLSQLITDQLNIKLAGIRLAVLISCKLPSKEQMNTLNIYSPANEVSSWDFVSVDQSILPAAIKPPKTRSLRIPPPSAILRHPDQPYQVSELNDIALKYRPELVAARLNRTAAKWQSETAIAGILPNTSLFWTASKQGGYLAKTQPVYGSGLNLAGTWSHSGVGNITEFIGSLYFVREKTFDYNQTMLTVFSQVASDYLSIIAQQRAKTAAQQSVSSAMQFLASMKADKVPDNGDVSNITNNHDNYVNGMIAAITAQTNYNIAQADMLQALGTNADNEDSLAGIQPSDQP